MIARPDWLSPNTSPSRRSLRSRSASSKPSSVDATALRRSPAFEPSGSFVTSRHRLGCCPRPMRPRSWCSWLMPNRSASITSITVALGTSTPTSITVVQTSTSISAARNAAITASFSSADSLPCMRPSRSPDSGPWPRRSNSSTTVVAGGPPVFLPSFSSTVLSSPSIRDATTYACLPALTSSVMRCQARCSHAGFSLRKMVLVLIGWRPRGSSRSVDVSRSP